MTNEFPTAQKFRMNLLVEYSNGGIVSKNILKRPTGNISLFAFDKGETLSEHTAPFDALVHILEGTANIIIERQAHTINAGETIIMPANIPHAVEAKEKFKMLLIMIKE